MPKITNWMQTGKRRWFNTRSQIELEIKTISRGKYTVYLDKKPLYSYKRITTAINKTIDFMKENV